MFGVGIVRKGKNLFKNLGFFLMRSIDMRDIFFKKIFFICEGRKRDKGNVKEG